MLFVINLLSEVDFLLLLGKDRDRACVRIHQSQRALGHCGRQIIESRDAWQTHFAGKQRGVRAGAPIFQKHR